MADISKIVIPDGSECNIKDTTARNDLADKMDKVNPTGSGKMLFNAASDSTGGTRSICLSYNGNAKDNYSSCIGGYGLVSGRSYQTIFGIYNEEDTDSAVVVGWGSSTTPKNIFTLSRVGAGEFASTIDATGLGATLKQAVIDAIYPVGSIYMTVSDDTAAKVKARFGGTWVAWGSGRVPVGVNTSDTSFNTVEKTGGGKTTSYTPAGTNSGCAVTKHTYTPAGTVGNTTLKVSQIPSHTHKTCVEDSGTWGLTGTKTIASGTGRYGIMSPEVTHVADAVTGATGGGGSHTHTFTGTEASLTHTVTQPKFTGTAHNISTVQPYITCYMWKRTA
jgi:hypothetical protein